MSKMHPECPNTEPPGRSEVADVLLRQEPDDGEDEEEGDDQEDDDQDETDDDGYSE
jgi:hypothetical protein